MPLKVPASFQETLHRAAVDAVSDTKVTKWIAILGLIAAIVAAIASVLGLFK